MINTRFLRKFKKKDQQRFLQMLTCYDFQTAQMLNETTLDLILIGDSLGNVILGYEHTVCVSLEEMIIFSTAVKKGAPQKFVVADLPFGTYTHLENAVDNACRLFQKSGVNALKLEGAFPYQLDIIERLTQIGIPIMGHIGLTPQSVHQQGGYYTHGKCPEEARSLHHEAMSLQKAGAFAIVLECVTPDVAEQITQDLAIPTIGIGSGQEVDGQVLVLNDLLHLGPGEPPKFCSPMLNLFQFKKEIIQAYLQQLPKAQLKETLSSLLNKE